MSGVLRHSQWLVLQSAMPTNNTKVTIERNGAELFVWVPLVSGISTWARYRLAKMDTPRSGWGFASNMWVIMGAAVVESDGTTWQLNDNNTSAWEYAYRIGVTDAPNTLDGFDFYGSLHQAEQRTSLQFSVDASNYDDDTLPSGRFLLCDTFTVAQTADIILPSDKTSVCGDIALTHTFAIGAYDLQVDHVHNYVAGYQIFAAYSAMMPSNNSGDAGFDTYKIGSLAAAARAYDDSNNALGTEATTAVLSHSSAHPYTMTLTLPYGGPELSGLWTHTGGFGMWFQDRSPSLSGIGKVYVNFVGSYADRITPPATTTHRTRYGVTQVFD